MGPKCPYGGPLTWALQIMPFYCPIINWNHIDAQWAKEIEINCTLENLQNHTPFWNFVAKQRKEKIITLSIYVSHYFCHFWSTLCDAVGAGAWCLEVLYYSRNFLTWWVVFDIIKLYTYILETYIIHMN